MLHHEGTVLHVALLDNAHIATNVQLLNLPSVYLMAIHFRCLLDLGGDIFQQ